MSHKVLKTLAFLSVLVMGAAGVASQALAFTSNVGAGTDCSQVYPTTRDGSSPATLGALQQKMTSSLQVAAGDRAQAARAGAAAVPHTDLTACLATIQTVFTMISNMFDGMSLSLYTGLLDVIENAVLTQLTAAVCTSANSLTAAANSLLTYTQFCTPIPPIDLGLTGFKNPLPAMPCNGTPIIGITSPTINMTAPHPTTTWSPMWVTPK